MGRNSSRAVSTFSMCAVDPASRTVGAVVASRYVAVGALVPHLRSGAGVVLTQSIANPTFGGIGLERLSRGDEPRDIVGDLLGDDRQRRIRQLAVLRSDGLGFAYSGPQCSPLVAQVVEPGIIALGNMLADTSVPHEMISAYRNHEQVDRARSPGLPDDAPGVTAFRMAGALLAGLAAGEAAGGDRRGKQAAAIVVCTPGGGYEGYDDRAVDLRVDDAPNPVGELVRVFDVFLRNRLEELTGDQAHRGLFKEIDQ